MRKFIPLVLACLASISILAQQSHIFEFELKGYKFDSLRIAAYDQTKMEVVSLWSKPPHQGVWVNEIPDSIWQTNRHFGFGNQIKSESEYEYVRFFDATQVISRERMRSLPIQIIPNEGLKISATYAYSDTIYDGKVKLIYHNFATNPEKAIGLTGMIKYPDFSSFPSFTKEDSTSYQEQLQTYAHAAKDCPDSRFLALMMLENLNKYHSSKDARVVFNCFSEQIRSSDYGKRITRGLTKEWTRFENSRLQNVLTGIDETMTEDSKKYRLVCFTASWCVNCRLEVPLLRKIYRDLKDSSFEMIYVSVDEQKWQKDEFHKQIMADSIPWRSLFSHPAKVEDKYLITAYPTNMLVYPDNRIEFVDVRDNTQRERLYRLVKEPEKVKE
jgi:thiol-disulfide isomerase/thioredoxin